MIKKLENDYTRAEAEFNYLDQKLYEKRKKYFCQLTETQKWLDHIALQMCLIEFKLSYILELVAYYNRNNIAE